MAIVELKNNQYLFFLFKFLILFAILYFINIGFIGITAPGKIYINFLDDYLNYIDWLRSLILHTSNVITRVAGLNSEVQEPYRLAIKNGPGVKMVYSCIGYGVMSLWAAFVIAYEGKWKQKALWILIGLFFIFVVNCFRVSMLLIALAKNWQVNKYIEHHDLFNLISYIIIFLLIYLYTNKSELTDKSKLSQPA